MNPGWVLIVLYRLTGRGAVSGKKKGKALKGKLLKTDQRFVDGSKDAPLKALVHCVVPGEAGPAGG
jgi:hypothetical protein